MKSCRQKLDHLLTPVPNGNRPGPGLALTHVSVLPDKAPSEETHSQSCRGKNEHRQNNPKPEGFSFLNPEQSQAPSPCKLPLAGMTSGFLPALGRSARGVEARHEPEHQQTTAQRKITFPRPSPAACKVALSFPAWDHHRSRELSPISPACSVGLLSAACFPKAAAEVSALFWMREAGLPAWEPPAPSSRSVLT